jgi:hypothetical protein
MRDKILDSIQLLILKVGLEEKRLELEINGLKLELDIVERI